MSLYTVPASDQFTADGKEYFKFPLSNVGWRVLWTTAPKDLTKIPRMELNRLVRMFEEKGLVLPMTLRRIKKADVLALITPLIAFS